MPNIDDLQVRAPEGEELQLLALQLPDPLQERPHQARECRPPRHQESQKKERILLQALPLVIVTKD